MSTQKLFFLILSPCLSVGLLKFKFCIFYHNIRIFVPQPAHPCTTTFASFTTTCTSCTTTFASYATTVASYTTTKEEEKSSILSMFVHWKFWTRMTSSNFKYDSLLHLKYKLWFESCFVYVLIIIISKSTLIGITFVLEYFNFVIKHTWTMWCVADD